MIWDGVPQPPPRPLTWRDRLRVARRGVPMATVVFGGLLVLLALRLIERPVYGLRRPFTPWITQAVCRAALAILGLRRDVRGAPMRGTGATVANHASWLDIFTLNASERIYFVSKSEVADWPGIGWLARATGTIFIRRDRREARSQTEMFEARLKAGHRLMFFPEGTSTDGIRVLPFKTTLFAAFFSADLPAMRVQPVTLAYHAPEGAPATFYGWWGDHGFGAHLLRMLAWPRHGTVELIYHTPLQLADYSDRKSLARAAEAAVRAGLRASGRLSVDAPPR
ncbi:1-acyl-sn-glycerol-3-phosphate acyltransferase [Jannaschia sp. S6380]|uniref:lysophospholipid acyltransferase family protein n=1 Tax=Jannaschia sp. S6380 TaxID=2926408 RepID=UPI001FF488D6|nr:lysophospholipid acyltransferase family protein [Jannaschia sp. S6380]MCK0166387.1 1-acyl-sn-glycerol-3-phosphate acyltransferase [Jannaschia sp. S6380]